MATPNDALSFLESSGPASKARVADALGVSPVTAWRLLTKLVDEGRASKSGENSATTYRAVSGAVSRAPSGEMGETAKAAETGETATISTKDLGHFTAVSPEGGWGEAVLSQVSNYLRVELAKRDAETAEMGETVLALRRDLDRLASQFAQLLLQRRVITTDAPDLDAGLVGELRAAAEEALRGEREKGTDVKDPHSFVSAVYRRLRESVLGGDRTEVDLMLDRAAYRNVAADLRRSARAANEALDKSPAQRKAFEVERRLRGHDGPLSKEERAKLVDELRDCRAELARLYAVAREAERRADPACFKRPSASALPENAVEVKR